jgi:hypothetical protein
MDRRRFLSLLGIGVAGVALDQAIPLGRVWSFPKEIVIAPRGNIFLTTEWTTMETLRMLKREFGYTYPVLWADCSYAAIRANGWDFPTAAFPPDSFHTPS